MDTFYSKKKYNTQKVGFSELGGGVLFQWNIYPCIFPRTNCIGCLGLPVRSPSTPRTERGWTRGSTGSGRSWRSQGRRIFDWLISKSINFFECEHHKEIVYTISADTPVLEWLVLFETLKSFLWMRYSYFSLFKLIIFNCGFSIWFMLLNKLEIERYLSHYWWDKVCESDVPLFYFICISVYCPLISCVFRRHEAIQKMMLLNPEFKAPMDYR